MTAHGPLRPCFKNSCPRHPKADKPEPTSLTQSGHAIERRSLDRRQCYVLDGLRKSFLGRSKTAVSRSPREQCHLWITAVGSRLISLKSSGLCSLRRQLALRGGSVTGSRARAGGTALQSSATRYPLAHD